MPYSERFAEQSISKHHIQANSIFPIFTCTRPVTVIKARFSSRNSLKPSLSETPCDQLTLSLGVSISPLPSYLRRFVTLSGYERQPWQTDDVTLQGKAP